MMRALLLLLLLAGCSDAQVERKRNLALAKCEFATELSGLKPIKDQFDYAHRIWLCMKAEGYRYTHNTNDGCSGPLDLSALTKHCWKSDD
jgi:hypothetical protein